MDFENSKTLSDWDKWKSTLAKAVNTGEAMGLSQSSVEGIGFRIGNMLSAYVDPENREERLLQELWKSGDDSDRKALSRMIVRIVQNDR